LNGEEQRKTIGAERTRKFDRVIDKTQSTVTKRHDRNFDLSDKEPVTQ